MSTRIRTRALAAFFAVTTGALVLIGAPAQAASAGDPGQSCWLNADTGVTRCFSDEEALQDAVADARPRPVEEGSALARTPPAGLRASFVIARFYDGAGATPAAPSSITIGSSTVCAIGLGLGRPAGVQRQGVVVPLVLRMLDDASSQNNGGGGASFGSGTSTHAASVGPLDNLASSYSIT